MGWRQLLAASSMVFAVVLLILVVTSHQWIIIDSARQTYSSGIWKTCTKMICTGIHIRKGLIQFIRSLFAIALFCAFFCSSYMLFTYRYSLTFNLSRFLVSAIGCFITGFLMAIAMTIYTIFVVKFGISKEASVTYQPVFYLAWCIGPIFALAGILSMIAHYFMPMHHMSLSAQDDINRLSSLEMKSVMMEGCRRNTMAALF